LAKAAQYRSGKEEIGQFVVFTKMFFLIYQEQIGDWYKLS